ncbi:MAG: CPBP family glutamic-type intramembrane protease [Cyanobacteria bacterium P01_A01_bin.114]
MFLFLYNRLWLALSTLPTLADWLAAGGLLAAFALVGLPFGFWTGFFRVERVKAWNIVVPTTLVALVYPGIFEEILFRALLLPRPDIASPQSLWTWAIFGLIVFVVFHPLNAWLVMTDRRETFYSPVFLTLAGLLGVVCTLSYVQSASLWPPVVLHWLMVIIWLLVLGGYGRLAVEDAKPPT